VGQDAHGTALCACVALPSCKLRHDVAARDWVVSVKHCDSCEKNHAGRGMPVNWRAVRSQSDSWVFLCSWICEIRWRKRTGVKVLDVQGFDDSAWTVLS
jgi:hypothetical protein